ncbi:MAG: ferritin family protein, partial [Methanomicrobiales archaeon]|nr:ferritin family protein [Methanomicrobiales archaeon]
VIETAISRDVEAYTFYQAVSERVKDAPWQKLCAELAGDETKHREFLQGLLGRGVKELHFSTSKDYKVVDALPTPALSASMKPLEGLVIAVKKELEAMQMYNQLANASEDAEQKKLFNDLATMERGHKSRLEDIYVNMAFPEAW